MSDCTLCGNQVIDAEELESVRVILQDLPDGADYYCINWKDGTWRVFYHTNETEPAAYRQNES